MAAPADEFPSNRELAEQNVALMVEGWHFGGGVVKEKGNGLETIPIKWTGSGFIVGRDGTLVTNYHVIARALAIEVNFDAMASRGGARYQVPYIKVYDRANDLAILQIDGAATFNAAPLGDSDLVEPRDDILAVGNPQNMGINITEGSVSQVQRSQRTRSPRMLVHTAQITSGNSGGSLYKGAKVIGVNVSVRVNPNGGQTGFNQAVPINLVRDLLENPKFDRRVLLRDVFLPTLEKLENKAKQIDASTQTAPAAHEKKPGVWSTTMSFNSLTDYLIVLKTYNDVDLDLVVMHGDQTIGHGGSDKPGLEALAITNNYRREVRIGVLNYRKQPVEFGISFHRIVW
jgi:hypothetical protein